MTESPHVRARSPTLSRVLGLGALLGTLLSAVLGFWFGTPSLDNWRRDHGFLPELRDDPVARLLGFDIESWDALQETLRRGDRYRVVARGPTRFEVRNYAAYALLPAVQVRTNEEADVVVYFGAGAPVGRCTRIGEEVCIERRALGS